jgi:hypothetical protein
VADSRASADITFVGPGGLAFFRFYVPIGGARVTIHMFQTMTPVSLMEQRVDFIYFAPRRVPSLVVDYVTNNWINNFKQDIFVWENKVFLQKPLLVRGDGPIMAMRRWYQQFYPAALRGQAAREVAVTDGPTTGAVRQSDAPQAVPPPPPAAAAAPKAHGVAGGSGHSDAGEDVDCAGSGDDSKAEDDADAGAGTGVGLFRRKQVRAGRNGRSGGGGLAALQERVVERYAESVSHTRMADW